ncbi:ROK family protein [Salinibacterium sp. dk2585]|uniref:polyphosphate--glucose phosphotransferase n=1 Tax=unclassified Salinibacterium TaxID=2632331 RepID=UPI0011C24F99|nr:MULTISPECIES: ROK family protein [unclassified Salinibacterium]QEE61344.1 ROK family protein [Salinibacterium sp. dk2585]TXK54021.1 ROK family protein [Salinibacterium sp. dk5596]
MSAAIGIDIGGTGIKAALVDLEKGALTGDRHKVPTPDGGEPDAVVQAAVGLLAEIEGIDDSMPVGVCFPAVVQGGRTMSAANVSDAWIGLEAEQLFEQALGRDIHFVNDADAAGVAEARYGAAKNVAGLVIMTTLGTGIGTALINNGTLVPNAELGHLEIDGVDWETVASNSAREREGLSWGEWAERLQRFYTRLERYLSPERFVVGGGVSKHHDEFLPLLDLQTEIVPAAMRNNAGIIGAAALARHPKGR